MNRTPEELKGELYPGRYAKCMSFAQCPACTLCMNYSHLNPQCVLCEDRKIPVVRCECDEETRRYALLIQERMNVPLINPNGAGKASVADVSRDKEWKKVENRVREISGAAATVTHR